MKVNRKFLVIVLFYFIILLFFNPNYSSAALQSNAGTPATKTPAEWIMQIRQMQSQGGTLGRTDTINSTTLLSNATDLDIHMEKNTEYGAMAILSASSYGKSTAISNGQTTTGNSTGVVINFNNEWVAATGKNPTTGNDFIGLCDKNVSTRYRNYYVNDNGTWRTKMGDATSETEGWHGKNTNFWFQPYRDETGYLRATGNSNIFSYSARGYIGGRDLGEAYPTYKWSSRAVIVVGSEL